MKQDIHPLIDKLNISDNAKAYFNEQKFYEMIQSPVSIGTVNDPVNEATENWWAFNVQDESYRFLESDLKLLYSAVHRC